MASSTSTDVPSESTSTCSAIAENEALVAVEISSRTASRIANLSRTVANMLKSFCIAVLERHTPPRDSGSINEMDNNPDLSSLALVRS